MDAAARLVIAQWGQWGYGAAAAGYAILTALLFVSMRAGKRRARSGVLLAVAAVVSLAWCATTSAGVRERAGRAARCRASSRSCATRRGSRSSACLLAGPRTRAPRRRRRRVATAGDDQGRRRGRRRDAARRVRTFRRAVVAVAPALLRRASRDVDRRADADRAAVSSAPRPTTAGASSSSASASAACSRTTSSTFADAMLFRQLDRRAVGGARLHQPDDDPARRGVGGAQPADGRSTSRCRAAWCSSRRRW